MCSLMLLSAQFSMDGLVCTDESRVVYYVTCGEMW